MIEFESAGPSASSLNAPSESLPALLERYRAGDQYAFTILYRKSADRVMDSLARRLRHPRYCADFLDAIQVSMLLLSQCRKAFISDGHVVKWLAKTARNVAINFHRRMRPTANSDVAYRASGRDC